MDGRTESAIRALVPALVERDDIDRITVHQFHHDDATTTDSLHHGRKVEIDSLPDIRIVTYGGTVNFALRRHIDQIRRRWWVVAIITATAVLATGLSSLTAHDKYVGKATLVVSSPQRAPEQDATVVVGYATVFNNPATIDRLRAARNLPQDVTFEAKTVAASPILAIEATGNNGNVAQESATSMAEAFRDDVNSAQQAANADEVADLQGQLNGILQRFSPGDGPTEMETRLRERINTLKFDTTNQLRDLQLKSGVMRIAPNTRLNMALGAAAGLLLGILAALGMAAVSTRIGNSAELLEKTGIEPLVELPGARSRDVNRVREDRLRTLANILSTQVLSKSTVIALIDSRGVERAGEIAEHLAKVLAEQDYQTVLVDAEEAPQAEQRFGFEDVLRDSGLIHVLLKDGEADTLKILPGGGFFTNRYSRISPHRIGAVLDELRAVADVIVLAAPSITDTPDTQLLCAAADLTIVIADTRSSRAADVSSVVGVLERGGAVVFGAVLINGSKRQSTESANAPRPRSPSASERSQRNGKVADQRIRRAGRVVPDLHQ
jgi:capsular polysaccharide biosynthesis protein